MTSKREAELEAEVSRLREMVQALQARGPAPNDQGVAGRVAITRLRDQDYPEVVAAVMRIPRVYREHGYLAAMGYIRTTVRSVVDSITLTEPRTGDLVRSLHRLHMMMEPGLADPMLRSDRAGMVARIEFLECVERYAYAASIRSAFAKSTETPPGLVPTTNYSR